MTDRIFMPADILLPNEKIDMERWSVIACDQFTSQPEYWENVDKSVGDAPSALRLMLPEAYLGRSDVDSEIEKVNAAMDRYLEDGVFRTLENSYVYVERTISGPGNVIRRGLVGVLDLEKYDYTAQSVSPVRATEGTVEERLPPRVKVRTGASLEMPHIMVFIDDPDFTVIEPLGKKCGDADKLYDFTLMEDGGRVKGWRVSGENAAEVDRALLALGGEAALRAKYGAEALSAPVIFAMGDGNHSLATAKRCWENMKGGLSEAERESNPARYALVEIVNVHDAAISFKPIHRVLFDIDPDNFAAEAEKFLRGCGSGTGGGHTVTVIAGDRKISVELSGMTIGGVIGAAESFCTEYVGRYGGRIDYVHGDGTASRLASEPGCGGLLLPAMDKAELFSSVIRSGAFPRKSFSIGHGRDKRYYLECRRLK